MIEKIKTIRPAALAAVLALFVVLTGTATAASGLINGKNIKKGTVTAKQIKNGTLTPGKFSGSVTSSLVGPQGAPGQTGPKGLPGTDGTNGDAGADGADGIPAPQVVVQAGSVVYAANEFKPALSLNVPSGKYVVYVNLNLASAVAGEPGNCEIRKNGGDTLDNGMQTTGRVTNMQLQAVTPANTTSVNVSCTFDDSTGSAQNATIIAVPAA